MTDDKTRDNKEYRYIFEKNNLGNKLEIYLTGDVDFDRDFINLIKEIKSLGEKDEIHIYINNYGGAVSTLIQLLNALKSTKAKTISYLEGYACSAASMVFLACDELILNNFSVLMLHYYFSGNSYQKGCDIELSTEFTKKHFQYICSEIYKDILTKKELESMFNGKDFWFTKDEIIERLDKKKKITMAEWLR